MPDGTCVLTQYVHYKLCILYNTVTPYCMFRYLSNFDDMKFKCMQCSENCDDLRTKLDLAEDLHRHLDVRLSEIKPELIQLERDKVDYTRSVWNHCVPLCLNWKPAVSYCISCICRNLHCTHMHQYYECALCSCVMSGEVEVMKWVCVWSSGPLWLCVSATKLMEDNVL